MKRLQNFVGESLNPIPALMNLFLKEYLAKYVKKGAGREGPEFDFRQLMNEGIESIDLEPQEINRLLLGSGLLLYEGALEQVKLHTNFKDMTFKLSIRKARLTTFFSSYTVEGLLKEEMELRANEEVTEY